jgi:uncharacterized protein YgbK (DUF1537 family)
MPLTTCANKNKERTVSQLLLGCIADDFTGGTDLASTLVRGGMRTLQVIGVPDGPLPDDIDAVVIALKTRTLNCEVAVSESLEALQWLRAAGCQQFFFKYCSTFDSTPRGNIGPVAGALADALGVSFVVACPAFPENKRTIFQGHLFVGDLLLSESGMRNHPLTPMADANLVRVLQQQTHKPVGLVDHGIVRQGVDAISLALRDMEAQGGGYAIVDAIDDEHLYAIGRAVASHKLVTGGSGIALGLPDNFRRAGLMGEHRAASTLPCIDGLGAVVSGSCSLATIGQVDYWRKSQPSFALDPLMLANGHDQVSEALEWARDLIHAGPVLIYASAKPESVKKTQHKLGVEAAGELIEIALSAVAVGLYHMGVRKLVVAGGETSGAVVKALGVKALRIGALIDPGVPWTIGLLNDPVALALKSGNFGSMDFFEKALANAP